jgi:hypothetical protein
VDPEAGPLQAFAFALREVRAESGSPPYRKLAKSAGYSAATLSEAASGVRKPTLDVVLAYVGACRGDAELWRKRWHELNDELARSAPVEPEPPVAVEAAPVQPPPVEPDPPTRRRSPWRWKLTVRTAAAVLLVGAVGAFAVWYPKKTDKSGCPPKLGHAAFTAVTYGAGARVHTGAARDAPVTETIPSGCTVGFVGYCLGDKIHDNTGGSPDIRWFKLPDGNVITSGIIHGNPPAGLAPSRCAEDHPGPGKIALTVAVEPTGQDTMKLSAKGTHLDIVGFAALYEPTADQPRRWRPVGFTEQTVDRPEFSVSWKLDQAAVGAGEDPVLIAAAGCLGGDGPTEIVDARALQPGRTGPTFPPVSLTPQEVAAAAAAACKYPA